MSNIGSTPFLHLISRLSSINEPQFSKFGPAVIASLLCGLHRGSSVSELLVAIAPHGTSNDVELTLSLFYLFRETLTVIWPFIGVPQVVPACAGLSALVEERGIDIESTVRKPSSSAESGTLIRRDVYKASGNENGFESLHTYFHDFLYAFDSFVFGYGVGGVPESIMSRREVELCITAAVLAGSGPTRQAKNHIKASFGYGWEVKEINGIVAVLKELKEWADHNAVSEMQLDVVALKEEAKKNSDEVRE